jgi:hypothetical protein
VKSRDTSTVTPDHLLAAASDCRRALEPFIDHDWAIQAGDLAWDVRTTVTHASDAVGWYAAHLALACPRRLRVDFRAHDNASNAELLDVLEAAAATLAHVASAAPSGVRAYHSAGMADASGFLAMGCDEILVHGWDALRAFETEFAVPAGLAEPVLRRLFPWAPHGGPPWDALLWANGRVDLPGDLRRPDADWMWHCAPLDEWDGSIPRREEPPPNRFEWDDDGFMWHPVW